MTRIACRLESAAPEERIVHGARRPASGAPGSGNETVDEWIETMQSAGIERVLCTQSERQLERYDELLDRYAAAFGASRVAHVPIRDHSFVAPSRFADEVLPVLRAADDAAEPIVVHCWAGLGRTGHVLALWLMTDRGYELAEAIETVRSRNRRPLEAARGDEGDGHAALRAVLDAVGGRGTTGESG